MITRETRIGMGFDVHAFDNSKEGLLRLGGIDIEHECGLSGHSDADVALHAITDALLGAVAAGDIGSHFPPSDPKWKDMDSAAFIKHAIKQVHNSKGAVTNIDLTIIGEKPKIGPHRDNMRKRIAEICGIDAGRVSVKATTTEKLGFTGRKEGLAAQAVVSVSVEV